MVAFGFDTSSSFSEPFATASKDVNVKEIWRMIGFISFLLFSVHSLAYGIVELGLFQGDTEYTVRNPAAACLSALQSSEIDLLETNRFEEWFDDSSTMELSQTGKYQGASDIKEYVEFAIGPFLDYYEHLSKYKYTPISLTEDECIVNVLGAQRLQVNTDYGLPKCVEKIGSYTLYFTVKPVFLVHKVNVFYSPTFLNEFFGQWLNTENVRDFVCDTMEANCQTTFQMNNLTSQSCRETYDALEATHPGGVISDNSKGCRSLHSVFAAQNKDHCPHLSFIPEMDIKGKIKCQEGGKRSKPSDLFTSSELDSIKDFAIQKGFPPDTLMRMCDYNPNPDFVGFKEDSEYKLGITDRIPLSGLSDTDFLCYFALAVWVTIVLTGLGTEAFVWLIFLRGQWDQDTENLWRFVQFLFPLSAMAALGLAISHNYLVLPMIVISCWKLGFPETLLYLHSGLYDKNKATVLRISDILNGIGTLIHHSAVALFVSALVTNLIPPSRAVIQVSIPALMQHWFVLMRYSGNQFAYYVIEILIEIWFEWSVITALEQVHQDHWIGGIVGGSILFAHWAYFTAEGVRLIADVQKKKADILNKDNSSEQECASDVGIPENTSIIRFVDVQGESHLPSISSMADAQKKNADILNKDNSGEQELPSDDSTAVNTSILLFVDDQEEKPLV